MQIIKKLWSQYVYHSGKNILQKLSVKLHFMISKGSTSSISTDNKQAIIAFTHLDVFFPYISMVNTMSEF